MVFNGKRIALGIEGSANKIGVGIVDEFGAILANPRRTHITPPGTGFMPRETAAHHRTFVIALVKEALRIAKVDISHVDLICYTKGPGMGAPLSVGCTVAKSLSVFHNIPIVGVNHCVAHIEMGRLYTGADDPTVLYVSGGNTQVIAYTNQKYSIFGETLDVALGNALDRIARLLKLSNDPAPGWQIEQLAKKGSKLLDCPYSTKGMDVSFSGLVSRLESLYNEKVQFFNKKKRSSAFNSTGRSERRKIINEQNNKSSLDDQSDEKETPSIITKTQNFDNNDVENELEELKANICFTLQEITFAMLVEITERTMAHTNSSSVLLVGGVACNLRLQDMMRCMAEERGASVGAMDERYTIDNGAMIAWTGMLAYKNGQQTKLEDCTFSQRFRTDEVQIVWRN